MMRILALLVLLCASACSQQTPETGALPADHLFLNARIYTVNAAQPWAEALVRRGDEIIYVGDNTEAMRRVGLDKTTPDPVPGAHYFKRYEDGTPTGWLIEGGAFGPTPWMPPGSCGSRSRSVPWKWANRRTWWY
jgi:predicted amidohydrolase YtcJ